jgi:hypothetical protein
MGPLHRLVESIALGNPSIIREEATEIAGVQVTPGAAGQIALSWGGETVSLPRAELLARLEAAMAARQPGEDYWLLRDEPLFWRPSAVDREAAVELEGIAAKFEALPAGAGRDPAARATVAVKRTNLLLEFERRGILGRRGTDWREPVLRELNCPILADYARAAAGLHEYFRSAERAALLGPEFPLRILGAHVSVDWTRRPPAPPEGYSPIQWLAICESEFLGHLRRDSNPQMVLVGLSGAWYDLRWRYDDGKTPALCNAVRE